MQKCTQFVPSSSLVAEELRGISLRCLAICRRSSAF